MKKGDESENICGAVPNELMLSRVRTATFWVNKNTIVLKVVGLEDDTCLVQTETDLYHFSQKGECLNTINCGRVLWTLWDQETCITCSYSPYAAISFNNTLFTWNFRSNDPSIGIRVGISPTCLETIQWSSQSIKLLAAGCVDGKVHLLKFLSSEILHTLQGPSITEVKAILPLIIVDGDDRDSIVCGFYCGTLVRWWRRPTDKRADVTVNRHNISSTKDSVGGWDFNQQVFMTSSADSNSNKCFRFVELVQLKSDSRKLVSNYGSYSGAAKIQAWDIESGQCLCVLPQHYSHNFILELGNSGLLVLSPSLQIWDTHEFRKLAMIDDKMRDYDAALQLSNNSIIFFYTYKKQIYMDHCQVLRCSLSLSLSYLSIYLSINPSLSLCPLQSLMYIL